MSTSVTINFTSSLTINERSATGTTEHATETLDDAVPLNSRRQISDSALVNTILLYFVIWVVLFITFCVIRPLLKRVYAARTYAVEEKDRVTPLTKGFFSWIPTVFRIKDVDILENSNLDTYMIMRTLRTMLKFFCITTIISMVAILPTNYFGGALKVSDSGGLSSILTNNGTSIGNVKHADEPDLISPSSGSPSIFMMFTMSNISYASNLLWVHLVYFMTVIGVILYFLVREANLYIKLRHKYLLELNVNERVKSRTLLITGLGKGKEISNQDIEKMFSTKLGDATSGVSESGPGEASFEGSIRTKNGGNYYNRIINNGNKLPGRIEAISIIRNPGELTKLVSKRDQILSKIEDKLTDYVVKCKKRYDKIVKKTKGSFESSVIEIEKLKKSIKEGEKDKKIAEYLEKQANILLEKNKLIESCIHNNDNNIGVSYMQSAFVLFSEPMATHMAAQVMISDRPFVARKKYIENEANDIFYENLDIGPIQKAFKGVISALITAVIVVTWGSFSVAISGLANIDEIVNLFRRLDPNYENTPHEPIEFPLKDTLQGAITPMLLTILVVCLPPFLRMLVWLEGYHRKTEANMTVSMRFFWFLSLTIFILPLVSNTLPDLLNKLSEFYEDPKSLFATINSFTLSASNFFLYYLILRVFLTAMLNLLLPGSLYFRVIEPKLFASSPRILRRYEEPNGFDWAASIPYHFLLFLIGITYSAINPFINIPCAMYFAMYYFVYRHHFTYVYDCRQFNLGGKSFHLSLRQTFGALYMAEVIWLIMMIVNIKNANLAILRVVLAALTIIATSVVQHYIESYLVPLFTYLPLNACEFIASCLCGESPCICSGHLSISINSPPADTYLQKFDTPSPSLSPQGPPEIKVLPPTEPNSPLFYTPVTSASPPADSPSSASNPSLSAANDLSTTFATSFKHPALKASYFSFIMVPADQTGFCDHIFQKLNHLGQHDDKTYFEVTTTGSIVSTRYKVKLDFNIPEPQPPV